MENLKSSPNKSQFGDNDRDSYHLPPPAVTVVLVVLVAAAAASNLR
jgi:hypothetical protein